MFEKGEIEGVQVTLLQKFVDERGFLVETYRIDSLPNNLKPMMSYVSFTEPGVSRGPHEHREQTDIFALIGPGNFKVCMWDNRAQSRTYRHKQVIFGGQDRPVTVIVPPGVVHAYRNISQSQSGMVINHPDKLYAGRDKKEPVDEIRHEDKKDDYYQDFSQ